MCCFFGTLGSGLLYMKHTGSLSEPPARYLLTCRTHCGTLFAFSSVGGQCWCREPEWRVGGSGGERGEVGGLLPELSLSLP